MKIIIQTLLRYKTSTILNIVGLSIAFAAFIVIGMQIRYELSYNKQYEDHERIYLLGATFEGMDTFELPLPIATEFRELMLVEELGWMSSSSNVNAKYEVGKNDISASCRFATCDQSFIDIFDFPILAGDMSSFGDGDMVLMSDKYAKQLFGDDSPIGKNIKFDIHGGKEFYIGAVYENQANNNAIESDVFINEGDEHLTDVQRYIYSVYVKLKKGVSDEQFEAEATNILKEYLKELYQQDEVEEQLSIANITNVLYDVEGHSRNTLYIMMAIALVIMLVGFINFINFAVSTIPLKRKNINLRRVVGATKTELRVSLILTDMVMVVLSFLVGVVLVQTVKSSPFAVLFDDTSFSVNVLVYVLTFVTAIVMGVLAGLYPAFYSTSFNPSLMLKGRFAMGVSGVRLRKMLIGFQYFVAIIFIAISMFITLQQNLLVNADGGYIKEGIIKVDQGFSFAEYKNIEGLREELMRHSQIKDVTFGSTQLGIAEEGGGSSTMSMTINGVQFILNLSFVYPNFLELFGIEILEGRGFVDNTTPALVINQSMADKYDYKVGRKLPALGDIEVVGICEDVNMLNMRKEILPTVYVCGNVKFMSSVLREAYIKVSGNSKEIFDHINATYGEMTPDMQVEVNYFTDVLESVYGNENKTKQMMLGFSLLSIIIALVGVFGLMSFDTRFRRKEISLRKINGATIKQIIEMFTLSYLKIVAVAFVFSVPVVYYAMSEWLKGFAYKIELSWWVFAVALLMVVLLTLVIALVQCYKAASENPVKSLKSE